MLIATHDVDQARSFDRVLCLNGRQIAFGPPDVLTRPVLEATYGGVDRGGRRRSRHPARAPSRPRRRRMTAWEWISEPWGQAFMQHAFLEIALVGIVGGWLGCWVLLYGVSYSAESLAHGMFPGLVGASLLGLPLVAGGAVGAGASAAGIAGLGNQRGLDRDTSVGVVITSAFGLGALLALMPDSPPGIQELLFGDVLAVTRQDLLVTALIALPVLALLWVLHERLLAVGFDRSTARAIGIAPRPVELAVMLLVAAAVVVERPGAGEPAGGRRAGRAGGLRAHPDPSARDDALGEHRRGDRSWRRRSVRVVLRRHGRWGVDRSVSRRRVPRRTLRRCGPQPAASNGRRNTCPEFAARRSRSERGTGMSDSVYRVTEVIGTSSESWEAAAQNAVATAGHTIRDLRVAEATRFDVTIKDGKIADYRVRLDISFKYDASD